MNSPEIVTELPANILYTLGYRDWRPQDIKDVVEELDAVLVDVRILPSSRNKAFTKSALESLLVDRYRHLRPCGNENFKGTMGPDTVLVSDAACYEGVRALTRLGPVVLMCMCSDHASCHRNDVAKLVSGRDGLVVAHLYPPAVNIPSARAFQQRLDLA